MVGNGVSGRNTLNREKGTDSKMLQIANLEKSATVKKWFLVALRLTFGILLLVACVDKILHPLEFAQAVENYRIFGEKFARWVAIWLPYLELAVGVLLILGIWYDAATILNFLMMAVFFIAVTQAYVRGLDINCGCFSADGGTKIDLAKLAYNLLLLIGGIILMQGSLKKSAYIQNK